jgi:CheY-like chemotaxis protein
VTHHRGGGVDQAVSRASGPPHSTRRVNLLLFEPMHESRKRLRDALRKAGHLVIAADSYGEALCRLQGREFDMAVCVNVHSRMPVTDDYPLLIDGLATPLRWAAGCALYRPAAGVKAKGIVFLSQSDSEFVHESVGRAWALLDSPVESRPS